MKPETITPASLHKKAVPVCNKCGSSNVRTEAFAEWNGVTQNWKIHELLDGNQVCADCGQDCEIKWKLAA